MFYPCYERERERERERKRERERERERRLKFLVRCVSSVKLATESAWTVLLSRRFHSIVVRGKELLY